MRELCSDELDGRRAGTDGERIASEYVYRMLRDAGVVMLTDSLGQDFRISGENGETASRNIVGIVEGSDPRLREEYIVVGAHYDHIGNNVVTIDGEPVVQLFQGADANASGVAVMIELARLVAEYHGLFPRSIIFVGFGAGECGVAGSWYFVNRAFEQIRSVKAMVDLDMIGRSGDSAPFGCFSQLSGTELAYLLNQTLHEPVVTWPKRLDMNVLSSDYLPFYERRIPVFLFTSGISREYRTVRDTPRLLDYSAMEARCNYLYHFLRVLSSQDEIASLEDDSLKQQQRRMDRVYSASECDVRPQFFHSDEKHFLQSWVYKYIKYPRRAIEQNLQGHVLVSFIVERDGSVTNVQIEDGIDELLDDEAVRVISVSPKWIPGQVKGEKVRTRIVIPVEFRLK